MFVPWFATVGLCRGLSQAIETYKLSEVMVGVRRALKRGLSWGFAPKRWIGVGHVQSSGKICVDLAKKLLQVERAEESSQSTDKKQQVDAVARRKIQNTAALLLAVYVGLAVGFIGYALYLSLVKHFIFASLISFAIALLLFSYGLRELMVYGQLRLARNNLGFKELFKHTVKGFRS